MLEKLDLFWLKRDFPSRALPDLRAAVLSEMESAWPHCGIKPGDKVAITVGSRGIANLAKIVAAICEGLRERGAVPVIVPAMGSHGGGDSAGQRRVLADYGVTEESTGAKIDDRMEVRKIGVSPEGLSVYVAKSALECDKIIVFNRVKAHTDFKGDIESGLCKIMAIGLGKLAGASYYHRSIIDMGFAPALEAAGRFVLMNCPVAFGLAVVEDAFENTAIVKRLLPKDLIEGEKELLKTAKEYMADLPFMDLDILIIDRIGKNISGTCMDTNVIGRFQNIYTRGDLEKPRIKRIYARDITNESHGNFCGLGRADFISRRLYDKMDFEATYLNCVTGLGMENGRIPIVRKDDREALSALNITIGHVPPSEVRLVWIRDTLSLAETIASGAFRAEIEKRPDLSAIGPYSPKWGEDGYLASPWEEAER